MATKLKHKSGVFPFNVGDVIICASDYLPTEWKRVEWMVRIVEPCNAEKKHDCEANPGCHYGHKRFVIEKTDGSQVEHLCPGMHQLYWRKVR